MRQTAIKRRWDLPELPTLTIKRRSNGADPGAGLLKPQNAGGQDSAPLPVALTSKPSEPKVPGAFSTASLEFDLTELLREIDAELWNEALFASVKAHASSAFTKHLDHPTVGAHGVHMPALTITHSGNLGLDSFALVDPDHFITIDVGKVARRAVVRRLSDEGEGLQIRSVAQISITSAQGFPLADIAAGLHHLRSLVQARPQGLIGGE
ncbi:hypothetical protein M8J71_17800 [Pseudarthrobacter sp. R1]|uniref:hypothetical protein n=1 Tax=Pseudarthrobacter sp. R1 TaxID=2944934 RepID=UPI00210A6E6E|nr:hypothetical protein [Pseudarthrobacter sp. R1]MCQ6272323.1 hypothetical protein [Pseudarthrobacter sp. R1]